MGKIDEALERMAKLPLTVEESKYLLDVSVMTPEHVAWLLVAPLEELRRWVVSLGVKAE